MSSLADWAYVNEIIVRPFVRYDNSTGRAIYGDPFKIKCYFTDIQETRTNSDGLEFTATRKILTLYSGIKLNDLVGGKPAKSVEMLNSTPFGEAEMDYRIYT